jgi:hypothetical protein
VIVKFAWEELSDAWRQGCDAGFESLDRKARELYRIQDFILNFESGGLEYNWTPEWDRFEETIAAMRSRGLARLAALVAEMYAILRRQDAIGEGEAEVWYDVLAIIDPECRLDELNDMISHLDDFGIPERWPT